MPTARKRRSKPRKQRPAARRKPRRTWSRRLLSLLVKAAALAILISVMAVLPLRWVAPPTSMMMLLQQAEAAGRGSTGFKIDYRWRDFDRISPHLALAVLAAEDQKFPLHHGFDFDAIADAVETRLEGGRLRGASTISQQVAKNLYLWPGKSLVRKSLEAYFTVLIETLWGKRRILEVYLNIAEFGHGIFGAEAAARRHFRRPAIKLSAGQAARLAAVLPNPKRMDPRRPDRHVRKKAAWIQKQVGLMGGRRVLAAL